MTFIVEVSTSTRAEKKHHFFLLAFHRGNAGPKRPWSKKKGISANIGLKFNSSPLKDGGWNMNFLLG